MHPLQQPHKSFEQEELEALTLQLMKMKELLTENQSLAKARERSEEAMELQFIQEKSIRESSEAEVQHLRSTLEEIRRQQKIQEQSLHQLGEQQLHKNEKIAALSEQATALEAELLRLNEVLLKTRKALDERDSELKTAQQHLAKKVRETSHLQEELEKAEQRAKGLQQESSTIRSQLESLKSEVIRWQKREGQLLEQLNERQVTFEAKHAKLETEHAIVTQQWREAEAQLHKLRLLEGQQQQLRAILVDSAETAAPLSHEQTNGGQISPPVEPPKPVRMRQNLFDQ